MVTHNNKLEIFERFEVDKNLPKHKDGIATDLTNSDIRIGQGLTGSFISSGNIMNFGTITTMAGTTGSFGITNGYIDGNGIIYPSVIQRLRTFRDWKVVKWFNKKKEDFKIKTEEKRKTMTIIDFFSSLATSLNDLTALTDIAVHYETAIANAMKAGQIALADQLKDRLVPAKTEAQLVVYGLNKYLSEEQVVEFYAKAKKDRNLKLTWIKNFVKPIPSKILDLKSQLDETFVFDNYCILHYDPNNDATNLTNQEKKEEEERRAKDPILFGVIAKSRRLYYIGDWIDEYCNLTLDVVMETVGDRVSEINNETVKTFIDRGFQKEVRNKISKPPTIDPEKVIVKEPVMIREDQSKEKKLVKKKTKKLR